MKINLRNSLTVLLLRLLVVYVVFMLCRLAFYYFNNDLIDPLTGADTWSLLRGSLMFDTVSIIYVNLLFIFMSLIPFKFRDHKGYKRAMVIVFMITNGLGLLVNVADVFYYPFKQARIVLGDFFLLGEDAFVPLLADFVADYWYGFVFYILLLFILYFGYKAVFAKRDSPLSNRKYYMVNSAYMAFMAIVVIFFVRGATFSAASFPISMNDAFLYTDNPTHTSFILSNPFCLIRTMGKSKKVPNLKYFDEAVADNLAPTTHVAADPVAFDIDRKTNVFIIILESFGKAHIKSLSDQFKPGQETNTPFLDSLFNEGYLFTNAHQNGQRSIDALPAIWASIPSFKEHFLSLPNSVAPYHALPACMNEMGYQTAFFHGAVKESMGFVSFGKNTGIKNFYSREEYEEENGGADFDGKWGIWDHKFFPFVHKKINSFSKDKPFFASLFTLSSHHPYKVPPGMEGQFTEGTLPIHRAIKYSDYSLKLFFKSIEKEPWYKNTLFIITADHSSGADSEKFNKAPYDYTIPMFFFKPGSTMKGKDDKIIQHIDIMPTLLGMLDYDKPYFSFGSDHFDAKASRNHFAINFSNSAFNCSTDTYYYLFNEKEVIAKSDYRKDPLGKNNLIAGKTKEDEATINGLKAFVQEYYTHLNKRNYLPEKSKVKKAPAVNTGIKPEKK
jgi:phosphoglycerol transferase MdoB-like AlkP superfamily enzyme